MAEHDEKQQVDVELSSHGAHEEAPAAELPAGWKYKYSKWLPFHYASPETQLLLVAFVCFLCPGMFNAVNGLGGGGLLDKTAGYTSNATLYAFFAFVGFFAGSIANWLGIKIALCFGGIGYCVYVASYLCYKHTQNLGFMIFSGFLLGCCAGVLWAAQGAIMMSYPKEAQKGRYISWFWIIFNMGGVIGSLVPLGQNIHATTKGSVSDGTYIGFIVLTGLGALLAFSLVDAKHVVRRDGSRIILMKNPTWKTELRGLWETITLDPYIMLLFPMFFSSNWFYTYQFNDVNGAMFNTRTAALNNVVYWSAQIVGATVNGFALDYSGIRRTTRAKIAWVTLLVLTMAIWGGGYAFQKTYTQADTSADDFVPLDWTDGSAYLGPLFLYIFYGFYDAVWQTTVYWFMGAMTNNSRKLANYAGFYKGIQSAGSAITWGIGDKTSFMSMFASCWGLLAGSLVVAAPLMLMRIKDTVDIEEDIKFTDETVEDVLGHKRDTY